MPYYNNIECMANFHPNFLASVGYTLAVVQQWFGLQPLSTHQFVGEKL